MYKFQFTQDMWDRFNAENILKQNPHIEETHIGKSKEYIRERARRIGHNAATFFSADSLDCATEKFLCDDKIEEQVSRLMHFDDEFELEVRCDDTIGIVTGSGGVIHAVKWCRFVCRFHKSVIYRNRYTGMPFDVVTAYPVRSNEKTKYGKR